MVFVYIIFAMPELGRLALTPFEEPSVIALFAEGNRAWLYMYGVESLTPYSRVLNNWRIWMLYPKIWLFLSKADRFVFYWR